MKALNNKELDEITEKYYKSKLEYNRKEEIDRIKQCLRLDKKKEKRILSNEELEKFGIKEEEEKEFRKDTLILEEKILTLGREISKLCNEEIKKVNSLLSLYPEHYLLEQEQIKENLYKIIYYFDALMVCYPEKENK